MADRQNLMFMGVSVALPGFLIVTLMGTGTLGLGQSDPMSPLALLAAMVAAAVAIGTANSIREVVKEVPICLRERSVGLFRSAYLASKLVVIGAVTAVQSLGLVLIATARADGPDHFNLMLSPHIELIFNVALTGIAAVALGLLLPRSSRRRKRAMALFPIRYPDPGDGPTTDEWGYPDPDLVEQQAEDRADHEKEQARRDAAPTCDARWETGLGSWLPSVLALLAMTAAALYGADRLLALKEPLKAQRLPDWPKSCAHGDKRAF